MPLVALRGPSAVDDEIEVRAHLATLLRLENVGLLLGAGASCAAGGLTMRGLWDDFLARSDAEAQWLKGQHFIDADALLQGSGRNVPNVEELLDAIEIAFVEWGRTQQAGLPELRSARAALLRSLLRAALLKPTWWQAIEGAESDVEGLRSHRTILQKLVAARQPGQASPWVFTTNYDLAIEWAADSIELQVMNGFLGVHSRRFSPQSFDLGFRNVLARGEARFGVYNIYLCKLHGSLAWQESEGQVFELSAQQAWEQIHRFLSDPRETELRLLAFPRAAKYLQTVGFTLGELLRRFAEFLARPQSTLIIAGYGFGDEHINRLLRSALLNPTLQLVIYYPEFDGDPASVRLPASFRKLVSLSNPRVTIIGGGAQAHLDKLADHLPDPLLYDDDMQKLAKALREARTSSSEADSA
jgi:hypothetical protein